MLLLWSPAAARRAQDRFRPGLPEILRRPARMSRMGRPQARRTPPGL